MRNGSYSGRIYCQKEEKKTTGKGTENIRSREMKYKEKKTWNIYYHYFYLLLTTFSILSWTLKTNSVVGAVKFNVLYFPLPKIQTHMMLKLIISESNVYWTVHHCNSWRMKDQIDVTCYFISLIMCSTHTTTLRKVTLMLKRPSLQKKTADVVIQQHSRKLLMMDILMSEICWANKKWNKIASDIKMVFHSSTIAKSVASSLKSLCTVTFFRSSLSDGDRSCCKFQR